MRAFHLWYALHDGEKIPCAAKILAHPECDFASQAILIEVDDHRHARVTAIGDGLPMPVPALPVPVTQITGRSIVSRLTDHVLQPIANRAPVGFEAEFIDDDGKLISYRAIALPCASNGVDLDTVLGVISFKILEAEPETGISGKAGVISPLATHKKSASKKKTRTPNLFGRKQKSNEFKDKGVGEDRIEVILDYCTFIDREKRRTEIMNYKEKLKECIAIDGAIAVALFDFESGMPIATEQSNAKALDLEVAAAGNTNVLRAKYATMKELGIDEAIEDILITLETQIHMIRPATSESGQGLIVYLVLDKAKSNLAMARIKLRQIEKGLEV